MAKVFDPDSMRLLTQVDNYITDISIDIVNMERKLLTNKNRNKKNLIEKIDQKKYLYYNLSIVLKELEDIGRILCGTEEDISRIPYIIERAKFMVK